MNTQEQRHEAVINAMQTKERIKGNPETAFYCFKDEAPQALKDIFLENFEIRDLDYEIFSKACDEISEVDMRELDFACYEFTGEYASVYTTDRLAYLNLWNEGEISDIMKEYSTDSIATACAIWYDNQINGACELLREYIIGDDNK